MKPLTENRKARFDYEILETLEAGIALTGPEVKSVRSGRAQLTGSFVLIKPDRAELLNAQIPPYQPNNTPTGYQPDRTRRLLLTKKELGHLLGKTKESGLTIVPLSMYGKGRRIKVAIGLARHKKAHDKRETIKRREVDRELQRRIRE
ncbi:MAG: SsrA-binding protein SmpB [Patescibacteria group bacterium]|nr:SsrA-binding protein SmpB [Patescibacteria group bacterium]